MRRLWILTALVLVCLVATGTVWAGPPSSGSFDMGNDIWLTIVGVERYPSPTLASNGLVFDMTAHYYTNTTNIMIEHSSVVLDEAQIAVAKAESGARAKLRKACEIIMETDPDFSAEMLGLRKRLEQMVAAFNSWITP